MIKVLENCHEVLIKGGKFIIVNSCNPEAGDTDHNVTSSGLHPGFRGIHIMTLCKTGRFRTKSEWLILINRLCCKVPFKLIKYLRLVMALHCLSCLNVTKNTSMLDFISVGL